MCCQGAGDAELVPADVTLLTMVLSLRPDLNVVLEQPSGILPRLFAVMPRGRTGRAGLAGLPWRPHVALTEPNA